MIPLKYRILILTYGLLTIGMGTLLFLTSNWINDRSEIEINERLTQSKEILKSIHWNAADQRKIGFERLVFEPRFQALAEVKDNETLQFAAAEITSELDCDAFAFLSINGEILAWHGIESKQLQSELITIVSQVPISHTKLYIVKDKLYEFVIVPLRSQNAFKGYIIGAREISLTILEAYSLAVHSTIELRIDNRTLLSSHKIIGTNSKKSIVSLTPNIELVVHLNPQEVTAPLKDALRVMIFFSLSCLFVGGIFAFCIAGYLSRPIKELAEKTLEVGAGNLSVRMKESGAPELKLLGKNFNSMVSSIRKQKKTLNEYAENLEEKVNVRTAELSESNQLLQIEVKDREQAEAAIRNVAGGVSAATGKAFFKSLVNHLAETLDVAYAIIAEVIEGEYNKVRFIAFYESGEILDEFDHDLAGTPYESIMNRQSVSFSNNVQNAFPNYQLLKLKSIKSFVGSLLTDTNGNPLGLIVIMDTKPLSNLKLAESLVRIFAIRTAAEIERKNVMKALATEKQRLATTIMSVGDGVITTDDKGKILLFNNAAEVLTGWRAKEAINKFVDVAIWLKKSGKKWSCAEFIQNVISTDEKLEIDNEIIIIDRNGVEKDVDIIASPIKSSDSQNSGVVLTFHDTTSRKLLELEQFKSSKLESIGVLAGGIAHDFNNILTGILGNISLVKIKMKQSEYTFNKLSAAENACRRAQALTMQLLTFAKGGSPVLESTKIDTLIHESANLVLAGTNIVCEFEIYENLWQANIDAGQISQVFNNLMINAKQAMPDGGILNIRCHNVSGTIANELDPKYSDLGDVVKIEIEDHGLGISNENITNIFDPYYTTKENGTGLGLTTCYAIIKNHKGKINVISEENKGTLIYIYLPAIVDEVMPLELNAGSIKTGTGSVLIMDDDEAIRDLSAELLTDLGYKVDLAINGEEAIHLYKESKSNGITYKAVILDLTIRGGMGGKATIKELLTIDPDINAIVVSGYSKDEIMSNYRAYGFKEILQKPFDCKQLSEVLDKVIVNTVAETEPA